MNSGDQDYAWQQFYLSGVQDTGIVNPDSYNLHSVPRLGSGKPYTGGTVPNTWNPSGMLYRSGTENVRLMDPESAKCDTGCVVDVAKPDPRVHSVKPLYVPSVFKAPKGYVLPTPYTARGMY